MNAAPSRIRGEAIATTAAPALKLRRGRIVSGGIADFKNQTALKGSIAAVSTATMSGTVASDVDAIVCN